MKNIAIYYRVSTDAQDHRSQIQEVETWLADLPEDKKPQKITVYEDKGVSGKITEREQYQKMLQAAFNRRIDTIVVYRLDRLSRNATDAIQILLELDKYGVGFISVTQPILNLGAENPFRRTILAAFAELAEIERETIVARVKAGLRAAKSRGVKLGQPQKYNDEDVAKVHQLRSEGKTYRDIAAIMELSVGTISKIIKSSSAKPAGTGEEGLQQ